MSETDKASAERGGLLYSGLARLIDVRRKEVAALAWSWLYIFAVLSAYYIMRPIRDQMGVAGGVNNLQWLFTGTLIGMLCLNIPFAYLVKTLPRARFIPISYRFFAANILVFALLLYFADDEQTIWIGRAFFIWISIFNLFVVSVFWALMVDIFSTEQGKRLFGFIAAGATIGAIAGSGLTTLLARSVPVTFLLIGSVLLLEVAVFAVRRLSHVAGTLNAESTSAANRAVGGSVFAGITHPFKSAYLLNVSLFVFLFAISATLLYFQQAAIVLENFASRGEQTAFFATIDLLVNCLTLAIELFLTGRILRYFGIGIALAFLPVLTLCGFATLAFTPALVALAAFQVLRRSADYAVARPAREVLYTSVPREDRYKAKNFIDTVVYRTGDQVGAWSYSLLGKMGLGMTEIAAIAIPLSVLWLVNSLWLGRKQEAMMAKKVHAI